MIVSSIILIQKKQVTSLPQVKYLEEKIKLSPFYTAE